MSQYSDTAPFKRPLSPGPVSFIQTTDPTALMKFETKSHAISEKAGTFEVRHCQRKGRRTIKAAKKSRMGRISEAKVKDDMPVSPIKVQRKMTKKWRK